MIPKPHIKLLAVVAIVSTAGLIFLNNIASTPKQNIWTNESTTAESEQALPYQGTYFYFEHPSSWSRSAYVNTNTRYEYVKVSSSQSEEVPNKSVLYVSASDLGTQTLDSIVEDLYRQQAEYQANNTGSVENIQVIPFLGSKAVRYQILISIPGQEISQTDSIFYPADNMLYLLRLQSYGEDEANLQAVLDRDKQLFEAVADSFSN